MTICLALIKSYKGYILIDIAFFIIHFLNVKIRFSFGCFMEKYYLCMWGDDAPGVRASNRMRLLYVEEMSNVKSNFFLCSLIENNYLCRAIKK